MRRLAAPLAVIALLGSAATAEGRRLVRYDVGGGIAGLSNTLVLKRDLKAARFATLKRRYEPDVLVFDGITEAVRYRGRTVSVSSGAHPPARLERVLRRLARLVR